MILTVAFLLIFGAMMAVAIAIIDLVMERQQMFQALRRVQTVEAQSSGMRRELADPFVRRVLVPTMRWAGGLALKFLPAQVVQRLRREIAFAGSPPGWDAERVLAAKVLLGGGGLVLSLLLAKAGGFSSRGGLAFMFFGAFIGYYIPEWVIRKKSGKRQYAIRRALPDALDLLSITVEAGLGFDAAMARVARQAGGPLGEEFHRVIQEMQIGTRRSDSLRALADRVNIQELKSFVLAMIQADIFGISIAKVLHVQAGEMRLKRRQRAEEQAQKVPVKILFPLLTCIFPAIFVILLGPAAISIYDNVIARKQG